MYALLKITNNTIVPIWVFCLSSLFVVSHRNKSSHTYLYRYFVTISCILYITVLASIKLSILAIFIKITLCALLIILTYHNYTKHININPIYLWLLCIILPVIARIMFTPIEDWDARSIWFFHAKMIYFFGRFSGLAGFADDFLSWSHLDYPEFIPCLSALSCTVVGFWNEFAPKTSLLILVIGFVLGLAQLQFMRNYWKAAWLLMIIIILDSGLSNGYMDSWVAVYIFLGWSLFIDYIYTNDRESLRSSIVSIVFISLIKNEGLALICSSIPIISACLFIEYRNTRNIFNPIVDIFTSGTLLIIISVVILKIYNLSWHITNDLQLYQTGQILHRMMLRFNAQDIKIIFEYLLYDSWIFHLTAIVISGLVLLYVKRWRFISFTLASEKQDIITIMAPLTSGIIYLMILTCIYLSTPRDLTWHLQTSADRVTQPIILIMLLSLQGIILTLLKTWRKYFFSAQILTSG